MKIIMILLMIVISVVAILFVGFQYFNAFDIASTTSKKKYKTSLYKGIDLGKRFKK